MFINILFSNSMQWQMKINWKRKQKKKKPLFQVSIKLMNVLIKNEVKTLLTTIE